MLDQPDMAHGGKNEAVAILKMIGDDLGRNVVDAILMPAYIPEGGVSSVHVRCCLLLLYRVLLKVVSRCMTSIVSYGCEAAHRGPPSVPRCVSADY